MQNKNKKPEFVYHGSPKGDIKEFIPLTSPGTGDAYGPQIYASDSEAVASMFMADVGKSWSTGEKDDKPYAIIPMNKSDFVKRDKGGFVYKLPGETFFSDPERGMGVNEWASSVAVKPTEVTRVDSTFDAMIENGVQVYFVSDELYKEMEASGKPKWKFLNELQPER